VYDIRRRGNKLSTGFVGSPYLNHVLTDHGRADVAFDLLQQKQWPSWLYAVTQGATTIWERWDGWTEEKGFQDIGMNSFNHYAYGAIGDWLMQRVAGIDHDPRIPGFRRLLMRPLVGGGLTHCRATYRTPQGDVVSEWNVENSEFHWSITVPPNSYATAILPDGATHELSSGTHSLSSQLSA
jgi:alpha-L-rhamnosidase